MQLARVNPIKTKKAGELQLLISVLIIRFNISVFCTSRTAGASVREGGFVSVAGLFSLINN